MIELSGQAAEVSHVNLRNEKHGEDDVLAIDVKFEFKTSNTTLDALDPEIKSALYKRGVQGDLDQAHLAELRFPQLQAPLKWESEIIGGRVTLHTGVSRKRDIVIDDAKVNELRLTPMQGGTVQIAFRVQFNPDDEQASRIPTLLGKMVDVTIEKPKAEEQKKPKQKELVE